MEPNRREQAEAFARCLELESCEVADAIRWADRIVEQEPSPEPAICEVCAMSDSHPLDVARALRAVPGNADPDQVGRVVAATLASTIATRRESASSLALRLFRASNEGKLPHPELQSMAQRAWDELGLAEDGIGGRTPNEVIDEMTAVLVSVAAGRRPVHEYGCRASDE